MYIISNWIETIINLLHIEDTGLDVLSQHNVLTGIEHHTHILGVGSTGDMVVDDAIRRLVLGLELVHKVLHRGIIVAILACGKKQNMH